MKIYRYESNYDICMIVEKEKSAEIWIYTTIHAFLWKLHSKPNEPIIEWFIEVTKLNLNYCYINLAPRQLFRNQDFAKEQLFCCLEAISQLSPKDFHEYIHS